MALNKDLLQWQVTADGDRGNSGTVSGVSNSPIYSPSPSPDISLGSVLKISRYVITGEWVRGAPSVSLSVNAISAGVNDNGEQVVRFKWDLEYLTDLVCTQSNPIHIYVYIDGTQVRGYSDGAWEIKDQKSRTPITKNGSGEIDLKRGSKDRGIDFKIQVMWNGLSIDGVSRESTATTGTFILPAAVDDEELGITPKPPTEDDPKGNQNANASQGSNTNDNREWIAEWSVPKVLNLDESTASSKPPQPTIDIEDTIMTIKLDIKDIPKSDYEVYATFEVVADNKDLVYSSDNAAVILTLSSTETNEFTLSNVHVELGRTYKVRCRTIKYVGNRHYISEWSDWSESKASAPMRPEEIYFCRAGSSDGVKTDSIYLKWAPSGTAKTYKIQYVGMAKDSGLNYEDCLNSNTNGATSVDTTDEACSYQLTGLTTGLTYYLRVCAVGEDGNNSDWSPIKDIVLGMAPAAPNTWSSKTTISAGESVNLYWVHNSTDESAETMAEVTIYVDTYSSDLPLFKEIVYRTQIFNAPMGVVKGRYYTDRVDKYLCIQNGSQVESLSDPTYFKKVEGGYDANEAGFYALNTGMPVFKDSLYTDGVDVYLCVADGKPESINDSNYFTKISIEAFTENMEVIEGSYYKDDDNTYICITSGTPESITNVRYFRQITVKTFRLGSLIFKDGAVITWEVRTAGITNQFSAPSTPRAIDVYEQPKLSLEVTDYEGEILDTLTALPINIYAFAKSENPEKRFPIGYYLSIKVTPNGQGTHIVTDPVGNERTVHEDEVVYYKYFDINVPLDTRLSAGDINLANNVTYTLSCIVTMNTGLTDEKTKEFTVAWTNEQYLPSATIAINNNIFAAAICPYCEEKVTTWYKVAVDDLGAYLVTEEKAGEDLYPSPLIKTVKAIGKNLANGYSVFYRNNCETSVSSDTNELCLIKTGDISYIRIMPMYLTAGVTYVLSYKTSSTASRVYWYDEDLGEIVSLSKAETFTPDSTGYYSILFYNDMGNVNDVMYLSNVQVEVGNKATTYALYQGVDLIPQTTFSGQEVYYTTSDNGERSYYCPVDETRLTEGVLMSVYRRNYDGSFTEISKDKPNTRVYVPDPHPALDYARYRIVAMSEKTGAVSYYDLPSQTIGCKSIIIQWDEDWNDYHSNEGVTQEKTWAGSLLRLPYNIDVTDKRSIEVEMIKYVGRQHPVAYYGTHLGETASWSCEIPKTDKGTIYALRRLACWTGNVYVREPSGVGYWAHIVVSFSQKHRQLTVPVSFEITRVEGGM